MKIFLLSFLFYFIVDGKRDCKRLRSEKKSSSGNVFDDNSLEKFVVGVRITDEVDDVLDIGNGKSTAR